ncbi:uncharacterized protein LOC135138139 isoform X2 [Zophobas morio]|uniref:uncharacterized protein LOC135138139 isoform X2 n=1 Tax=Zophobas morio TaxID=2755281 RepID=UPI003082BDAB
MSIAFVKFWASVLTLVMSTFEKIVAQENLLDLARDFRFFKGNKIDIEENNITVITCNCPTLNFHFILKNGYVKRYISSSTTHECYTYEIGSTSEKMQVVHNGEVVATAEDSLEIMILKCSSKHASWKILRTCWEGFESHPCRIDCRHQHGGNGVLYIVLVILAISITLVMFYLYCKHGKQCRRSRLQYNILNVFRRNDGQEIIFANPTEEFELK